MLLGQMDIVLKSYIIRAVRMAFPRSATYKKVKERNRIEKLVYNKDGNVSKRPAVFYRCERCLKEFKSKDVQVDHRDTVVGLYTAYNDMTLDMYINKVFCDIMNLWLLCKSCHSEKTKNEQKTRKKVKYRRKK